MLSLCRHRTARSKTVFLGRQQLYAVPARSTAQAAILVLPPCDWRDKTLFCIPDK